MTNILSINSHKVDLDYLEGGSQCGSLKVFSHGSLQFSGLKAALGSQTICVGTQDWLFNLQYEFENNVIWISTRHYLEMLRTINYP